MSTTTPLTDAQIEALYAFVKSKYVDYYDVQLELVDHLASEVEQRMAANPAVSFATALQQVYSGFGIFGFLDVVELKAAAVMKRNKALWWKSFKELFQLPMLIGSLIGGLVLLIAFNELDHEAFAVGNGALALLTYLASYIFFLRRQPSKQYKLSAFQYNRFIYIGAAINFYQVYSLLLRKVINATPSDNGWLLLIPLCCWLGWLVMYAGIVSYSKMLKEQQKLYPMAFA